MALTVLYDIPGLTEDQSITCRFRVRLVEVSKPDLPTVLTLRKECTAMLADLHMYATLPSTDLERARRFYAEKLGLTPEREGAGSLF